MKTLGTVLMVIGFLVVGISSIAIRLDLLGIPTWLPYISMVAGAAIFFGGLRLNPISESPAKDN